MQCIGTGATGMISELSKSVLRNKFLILDTYNPDTLHLPDQGCGEWLFFDARRGPKAKEFAIH
jgi:hypothetical protein